MTYEEAKILLGKGQQGIAKVITWLEKVFEQDNTLAGTPSGFGFWQMYSEFLNAKSNIELANISERLQTLIANSALVPHWKHIAPQNQQPQNQAQNAAMGRQLPHILKSLRAGKCVLFLGANLLTQNGEPLHKQFYRDVAQQYAGNGTIYNEQEGFFVFGNSSDVHTICSDIAGHYAQNTGVTEEHTRLYNQIARLPFSLIVNLTPHRIIHDVFTRQNIPFEDAYFDDGRAVLPTPTQNTPLIYNLFGDCQDENSLIIGYDNLFVYLKKLLAGDSLLSPLHTLLQSAQNLIFLGFEFDKWYGQILLSALKLSENGRSLARQTLASDLQENEIAKILCANHFHFSFVHANGAENFIEELIQQCFQQQIRLRR